MTVEKLEAGMPVLAAGGKVLRVSAELAAAFQPGDSLAAVAESGQLLHIPAAERQLATAAVTRAVDAFAMMGSVTDQQISRFYEHFATMLEDDAIWAEVSAVNERDVTRAQARGRSTTRLIATEKMRRGMIEGLRGWITATSRRGQVLETVAHDGFTVELVGAALGVVAFVFEGRPNVLADACGVLRGGNTVVFRIGSDALQTAQAIMRLALAPALQAAGLPAGAVVLVESAAHAAGWALFSDSRLGLAVARGSGPAVATLGALARGAGVSVSLHGTGGAWIVAAESADAATFGWVVQRSLDRKVCNTLNTCCIVRSRAQDLVPLLLENLTAAAQQRGQQGKLHVVAEDCHVVPAEHFTRQVLVRRAEGDFEEPFAEPISRCQLGHEWEWEETPEVTLALVDSVDEAVVLFNEQSPQFVASLISNDSAEQQRFYEMVNAPFVGDNHTRWVDGQFALNKPELGLSNWQHGRLFGRGGILSGDSVYTVRTRYRRQSG
ncbi:MAG: aldehyde dehydrogenase family protein [Caldilineaceae bacterium]|nr:aldehyde dehydrogenase family protein [Caldilineaceae bacterium]